MQQSHFLATHVPACGTAQQNEWTDFNLSFIITDNTFTQNTKSLQEICECPCRDKPACSVLNQVILRSFLMPTRHGHVPLSMLPSQSSAVGKRFDEMGSQLDLVISFRQMQLTHAYRSFQRYQQTSVHLAHLTKSTLDEQAYQADRSDSQGIKALLEGPHPPCIGSTKYTAWSAKA